MADTMPALCALSASACRNLATGAMTCASRALLMDAMLLAAYSLYKLNAGDFCGVAACMRDPEHGCDLHICSHTPTPHAMHA